MSFFVSTKVTLATGEQATVYYLTEEGKKRLEQLIQNVAWTDRRIDNVNERVEKIQNDLIENLYTNSMVRFIFEKLKGAELTERQVAQGLPDFSRNPLTHLAFIRAWEKLEREGVIIPISHGRGRLRTWKISIQEGGKVE
jgi:arginine deiminase